MIQWRVIPTGDCCLLVSQMRVMINHLERGMPQILLQEKLRAAAQKEVGGIGVAAQVSVQARHSGTFPKPSEHALEARRCQRMAIQTQEEIGDARMRRLWSKVVAIVQQGTLAAGPENDYALFPAFAQNLDVPFR